MRFVGGAIDVRPGAAVAEAGARGETTRPAILAASIPHVARRSTLDAAGRDGRNRVRPPFDAESARDGRAAA